MKFQFSVHGRYNDAERQTGFNRYRQLLHNRFFRWLRVNLLTLLGLLPLLGALFFGAVSGRAELLLPGSIAGGMIFGPFLAGMYDSILRGLRDDPRLWWDTYTLSWKQNWRDSLLPGAVLGLMLGLYTFIALRLFWWSDAAPPAGVVAVYLAALLVMLVLNSLYWPQLVLFRQRPMVRIRNGILFMMKHFWRVIGAAVVQLAYWLLFILFSPAALMLLPVLGIWYIVFLSQFLIYEQMDEVFQIEARYAGTDDAG